MKIIILYQGKFPSSNAGAKRIECYKKGLIAAGNSASIISVDSPYKGRLSFIFNSIWNLFASSQLFFKFIRKADVLVLYGFDFVTLPFLALLARLFGVKIYLEVNERVGTVYSNRFLELWLIKKLVVFFTEGGFLFFNGFIVISEKLREYVVTKASKSAEILVVPILVDPERNSNCSADWPTRKTPYILHSGALSDRKDGIVGVFKAFSIACNILDKKLDFYLTLNLAPAETLKKIEMIIEEGGLENNVHFLGELSENELLHWQKNAALVVINKYPNEQNLHNFPTKLGEYMILGIPVVTSGIGEMANYLEDDRNALLFRVNDNISLSERIVEVVKNPERAKLIGMNGLLTAKKHFDYVRHGQRLSIFFMKKNV